MIKWPHCEIFFLKEDDMYSKKITSSAELSKLSKFGQLFEWSSKLVLNIDKVGNLVQTKKW